MTRPKNSATLYRRRDGKWGYRVKARNGKTIAPSQGYSTKANAKRGCLRAFPDAVFV